MFVLCLLLVVWMAITSHATNSSIFASPSTAVTDSLPNITFTILPVPAPTGAFSLNDTAAAARLGYQPTYNVDYPGQDIFPWLWTRSYEECLRRCDSYNANKTKKKVVCKAALFAPARLAGRNDCYLKKSLDNPQLANVTLLGGSKIEGHETVSPSLSSGHANSTPCPSTIVSVPLTKTTKNDQTSSDPAFGDFDTRTIHTKSSSSSTESDTGRPSISSTPNSTGDAGLERTEISSISKPTSLHVSTASEPRPSNSSQTVVLTLPASAHTHGA